MTASTPVPGWYHDPADARLVRWWDGSAWTEHVQDAAAVSAPTAETAAVAAAPAEPRAAAPAVSGAATAIAPAPASTFAAPTAAHTATTATPEGFLLPDPQASPGRRPDAPVARRSALETAPPPQLPSRRERRQLESATSTQSGESAPSTASTASSESAGSGASTSSAPAASSLTGPQPTQPVVDLRIPPLEAFNDPGVAAFAAVESPVPGPTVAPPPAPAEPSPRVISSEPVVPSAPAEPAVPDFPAAVPHRYAADAHGARPADAPGTRPASAAIPATLPQAPIAPSNAEDDEGFARPWVSVDGGAVPLSAVELASVDYEPLPRGVLNPPRTLPPAPTRSGTVSAWMLAFSPLIALLLLVGALLAATVLAGGALSASAAPLSALAADTTGLAILGGVLLAIPLLLIVWVVLDRRALSRFGFQQRASGFWILLGPLFYLIARAVATRREGRGSASPAWVHVGVIVTVAALGVAAPFLAPREATVAEMRTVEQSIAQDLQSQDLGLRVVCPDSSDARIGSVFVCNAVADDSSVVGLITVRWAGVDGSIQYWVELGDLPTEATG